MLGGQSLDGHSLKIDIMEDTIIYKPGYLIGYPGLYVTLYFIFKVGAPKVLPRHVFGIILEEQ